MEDIVELVGKFLLDHSEEFSPQTLQDALKLWSDIGGCNDIHAPVCES